MTSELGKSNVRHEIVETLQTDSGEETDAFIASRVPRDAYEKKLTQSEDVTEWIDDPSQISLIQPNLRSITPFFKEAQKPWSILDIGCYAGYIYDYLRKVVSSDPVDFAYTGVDIREEAIAAAKAFHAESPSARFLAVDLFELARTFDERQFDFCFSSRVLVHLPRFDDAMRNILFCSRKDTFVLIPFAKVGRCEFRRKIFVDAGSEMPYIYRYFSKEMIANVAKENKQRYTIYDSSHVYAVVHFERKKPLASEIKSFLGGGKP